jgi:Streptomycin adenylyltransferase
MNVSAFLEMFGRWAAAQPDVKAAALVGSYARDAATPGSDVDLLILVADVAKFIREQSWVSQFGEAAECREEDWGRVTSLRTFYKDGLEVEYGFATSDWAEMPIDAGSFRVVADGMSILYDPLGILSAVQREVLTGSE